MTDKLTITIPPGKDLPIAYNDCRCDCHRIPGNQHSVPCCLPQFTYEDSARALQPDELPAFVDKHHDTVRQLGILAADRLSDDHIDEIAHRLKMLRSQGAVVDYSASLEALLEDVDSLIRHAKSLQLELDVQVNFK